MSLMEPDRESQGTLEIAVFEKTHGWAVEVQDDEGARRVALPCGRLFVGAARGTEITVMDPTVSARHVALVVAPGGVAIEDLASKNGTFVGGARVKEARGSVGTTIVLGRSTLTLRATGTEADDADADTPPLRGIAGGSIAMRRIAARVRRFARHGVTVLVTGETGTGKELVAGARHEEGARARGPFVAVNVASLPRELVESELFGHERGAFTGAVSQRPGAFDEAHGGTLFLDEIGEMAIDAQPKLLRALDGYEVRRVGATGRGHRADVRIVAATNRSLATRVDGGHFREDLYHRLRMFEVRLPPLRDRRGDIGPIARAILASAPEGLGPRTLTSRALARLVAHEWRGNVRELRGVLYRASDHARNERAIDLEHVEAAICEDTERLAADLSTKQARALVEEHRGNVTAAARAAGVPRSTFRKRLGGGGGSVDAE
jgi:DNA-binding NtrC family response regulator